MLLSAVFLTDLVHTQRLADHGLQCDYLCVVLQLVRYNLSFEKNWCARFEVKGGSGEDEVIVECD